MVFTNIQVICCRVLSVAIEALTAFIRSFVYPIITTADGGILLNPVLAYLGGCVKIYRCIYILIFTVLNSETISFRALSLISSLRSKQVPDVRSALDLFTTRTLMAYRSLSNPVVYKTEHEQMLQLCSSPFRFVHLFDCAAIVFRLDTLSCFDLLKLLKYSKHYFSFLSWIKIKTFLLLIWKIF